MTLTWSGDNLDPTQGKHIRGELLSVDEWEVCVYWCIHLKDRYEQVQVLPTAAPYTQNGMSQVLLVDLDCLTLVVLQYRVISDPRRTLD